MNKKYLIVAFFVFLLLVGIIYYEKTRDVYKPDKMHWIDVMKNISSIEMAQRLLNYFSSGAQDYYRGNFSRVLDFVRGHIYYEKQDFIRSEDPEDILWRAVPYKGPARCGEFVIAYTALTLAFGIESRMVVFLAYDHMVTQVYVNGTWITVDPSEGRINQPYLYEESWYTDKLPLHDFWAFNADGTIEDVTEMFQR